MRYDPEERTDTISATIENYRIGAYGSIRAKSALAACGLNATEIEELLAPHRAEATKNWRNYIKPVT